VHGGHTYYFCADDCKKKFEADPGKYLSGHGGAGLRPATSAGETPAPPAAAPAMQMKGAAASVATVKDPVCGMDVDPRDAAGKAEYQGRTYYFCSLECKQKFEKAPAQYIK